MNEKINKATIHIVRILLSPLFIGAMLFQELYEAAIRLGKRTVLYFTIPLYTKTEVEQQYEDFKKRYPFNEREEYIKKTKEEQK